MRLKLKPLKYLKITHYTLRGQGDFLTVFFFEQALAIDRNVYGGEHPE